MMNNPMKYLLDFSEKNIRILLFWIGLALTIWRGYECLQKYLHSNVSVRIEMVKSNETTGPSLTICPEFFSSYNEKILKQLGINKSYNYYRNGEWYGNSTLDGRTIFRSVTHNFSDIVESLTVRFKGGGKSVYAGSFENLNITEKGQPTFGRCFEIYFMNKSDNVYDVTITFYKTIYIYFNLPQQFWNDDYKSKIQANVGEKLYLDITYDILKNNFAQNCKSYDYNSYDLCKETEVEKEIINKFDCTVPFFTTSKYKLCSEKEARNQSSDDYYYSIFQQVANCPPPCTTMLPTFGFPTYNKINQSTTGFARLYFKSVVKITEDFVSYDLLRYFICFLKQLY